MSAEVASASIALLPTFKGGAQAISKQLDPAMGAAGQSSGQVYGTSVLGTFKKFAAPLAGIFAGAKVIEFINDSVGAASDLSEAGAAVGQVFGDSYSKIEQFASGAATTLGQSTLDVLDASKTFGVFGKAAGLSGDELVGFSTNLVQLSTDLASFQNTTPEEAVEALGAALRGESEPLRRYGVLLDDASLKAIALEKGIIQASVDEVKVTAARRKLSDATSELSDALSNYGEGSDEAARSSEKVTAAQASLEDALGGAVGTLTPAQRTMAAYQAILEQTSTAQGDFSRTSDGLANQQRILAAQTEDFKARFGQALLPLFTSVVTSLNSNLFPALDKFVPMFSNIAEDGVPRLLEVGESLSPIIDSGLKLANNVLPLTGRGFVTLLGAAEPIIDVLADMDPKILAVAGGFLLFAKYRPQVVGFFDSASKALQGFQERQALQAALAAPMTDSYRGLQRFGEQIDVTERVGGQQLGRFGRAGSAAFGVFGGAVDGAKSKLSVLNGDIGKTPNVLGAVTSFLGGPWGIALGIGVTALSALAMTAIPQAASNVDELTSSFEQNTGAITDNTRQSVFNALQQSGAIQQAKDLGINLETVTDAAMGNTAAQAEVNAALEAYRSSLGNGKQAQLDYNNDTRTLTEGIGQQNQAVTDAVEKFRDQAEANGTMQAAQDALTESVTAATQAIGVNGATLDQNTAQGTANQAALQGIADKATSLVETQVNLGSSTYVLQTTMQTARDSFIATAEKMGLTRDQAAALADQMLQIPNQKVIDVVANTYDALAKIDALNIRLDSIRSRQVEVSGTSQAFGFAGGGTVWGPGTSKSDSIPAMLSNGEEVIQEPYASRNRSLLKAINAGMNVNRVGFASGGTAGGSGSAASDRPIFMESGELFGVIREMANGEARLVLSDGLREFANRSKGGVNLYG